LNAKIYCKNCLTLPGGNYLYIYGRPGYSRRLLPLVRFPRLNSVFATDVYHFLNSSEWEPVLSKYKSSTVIR